MEQIRKIVTYVEDTLIEGGKAAPRALTKRSHAVTHP